MNSKREQKSRQVKRIMAIAGLLIIAALYVITFVLSFMRMPGSERWLMAALASTVAVPALIWIYLWIYRLLNKDQDTSQNQHPNNSKL